MVDPLLPSILGHVLVELPGQAVDDGAGDRAGAVVAPHAAHHLEAHEAGEEQEKDRRDEHQGRGRPPGGFLGRLLGGRGSGALIVLVRQLLIAQPLRTAERPRRVTFTGSYNARPRVSPDGKQLAILTLAEGSYRIAVQDLASNNVTVLSKGRQEESPSFAPNGAFLIFGGRDRGQGVLQTVSVDGLTTGRLEADAGEVREPVWGPFLP